jgi:hypothetical protein
MNFVIIKHVKIEGKELPVLLLNHQNEVLSFHDIEDAEVYLKLFKINSDSGHRYEIKNLNQSMGL